METTDQTTPSTAADTAADTTADDDQSVDPQAVIDGYFECWNATDPERRAAAISRTWAEDATSSDPLAEATGHEALAAMFAAVQEQYPGHSFRQVGGCDGHHRLLRWGWEMVDADGARVLDGLDVALLSDDGRLYYLAGFFGADLPAAVS